MSPAPSAARKTGCLDPKRNLIQLAVLAVAVYAVWCFLPAETKQTARQLASGTGVDKVLSWEARAQNLASRTGSPKLGEQIVAIVHPTMTFARMDPVTSSESGGVVSVTYRVHFKGAILGNEYRQMIVWRFDKAHHIGVEILEDTAPTPVLLGSVLNTAFSGMYVQLTQELAK